MFQNWNSEGPKRCKCKSVNVSKRGVSVDVGEGEDVGISLIAYLAY